MKHLTEEQLIEYRYGEARAALEEHLRGCESCRASYAAVERVLAAVDAAPVPERDAFYGSRVWHRLEPRLDERRGFDWRVWVKTRRVAALAVTAALLVAAFLAGRFWPRPESPVAESKPEQVRERILLVAVGDHLDRSQMVLVELANADGTGAARGSVDISSKRERARELVGDNRLYRQAAARSGDAAMANVLDELERVLLEIAHSPAKASLEQLGDLRRRIEAQGILFKVRVIGSQVREREKSIVRQPAGGGS